MKVGYLYLLIMLLPNLAMTLELQLSNPPGDYNIYSWQGRNITHAGKSSKDIRGFRFTIPDEYVVKRGNQVDIKASLYKWRKSTPVAEGNPRTRRGIGYYPFKDADGIQRYIALEHINQRMDKYQKENNTELVYNQAPNFPQIGPMPVTRPPKDNSTATAETENTTETAAEDKQEPIVEPEQQQTAEPEQKVTETQASADSCKAEAEALTTCRTTDHPGSSCPKTTAKLNACETTHGLALTPVAPAARSEIKTTDSQNPATTGKNEDIENFNKDLDKHYGQIAKMLRAMYQTGNTVNCQKAISEAQCMVCNCDNEAGNQNESGQIAVARVVLTRSARRHWPSGICKNVWAPSQFSWTLNSIKRGYGGRKIRSKDVPIYGERLNKCIKSSLKALRAGIWEWDSYLNPYVFKPKKKNGKPLPTWFTSHKSKRGSYSLGHHVFVNTGRPLKSGWLETLTDSIIDSGENVEQ